ncbi:MAG: hypothetical protein KHX55_02285 [Proteobacteria bacterium]|nr:hypothetical protein [Pseudomonadota bacterium]
MTDEGFMTADEIKIALKLNPETDNRTLNKYVVQGKLEIKPFSKKVKLYRFAKNNNTAENLNDEEWNFA